MFLLILQVAGQVTVKRVWDWSGIAILDFDGGRDQEVASLRRESLRHPEAANSETVL